MLALVLCAGAKETEKYQLRLPASLPPTHNAKAVLGRLLHCAFFGYLSELFLRFLIDHAFAQGRVELQEFELTLDLLLVLAAEIHVVRFRGAEFYEAVL